MLSRKKSMIPPAAGRISTLLAQATLWATRSNGAAQKLKEYCDILIEDEVKIVRQGDHKAKACDANIK